jgi:hypothetical protein
VLRDLLLEMEAKLLVELLLTAAAEPQRPHLGDNEIPHAHGRLLTRTQPPSLPLD